MNVNQEIRRPGLGELCAKIKAANPSWSTARVLEAAKTQYVHPTLGSHLRDETSKPRREPFAKSDAGFEEFRTIGSNIKTRINL